MEHLKISSNFLNESGDSKLVTRKWKNVKDQSNANYNAGNEIIYNTDVLKCNLCDLNDTYIPVTKKCYNHKKCCISCSIQKMHTIN